MTADPPLSAPFRWDGGHIAVRAAGGTALFTTRRAGSHASLGLPRAQSNQVHGRAVRRVLEESDLHEPPGDFDGQATALHGTACVVMTADCLPVALLGGDAVAMVHAGWRGLAAGILEEGVTALRELGAGAEIVAAIGPGAGRCCYEVGDEVQSAFGIPGSGTATIDLKAIATAKLGAAGVQAVHDVGLCTICSDASLFHSYRRDAAAAGRQAALAWLS